MCVHRGFQHTGIHKCFLQALCVPVWWALGMQEFTGQLGTLWFQVGKEDIDHSRRGQSARSSWGAWGWRP